MFINVRKVRTEKYFWLARRKNGKLKKLKFGVLTESSNFKNHSYSFLCILIFSNFFFISLNGASDHLFC
jgi:hypothetical protein